MRWLTALILLLSSAPAWADDVKKSNAVVDPKLRKSIERAIERGAQYLKSTQGPSGSWVWSGRKMYTPGVTALALYALAASRVGREEKCMIRGFKWTARHSRSYSPGMRYSTYSASALVLALARSDPERHAARVRGLAAVIANGQTAPGAWSYTLSRGGGGDNSNSQFAVMALWMAQTHCGYKVPETTWKRVLRLYTQTQSDDGGWGYAAGRGGSSDTMTAAGLFGYLAAGASLKGGPAALPELRKTQAAKEGMRRLQRSRMKNNFYYLYGLERAATLADAPPKEWYVDNARDLVASQRKSGGWGHKDPYSTSLALLFLSRATRYVVTPRKAAVTIRAARFPPVVSEKNLKRAFEAYLLATPTRRAQVRARFGGAGVVAIGLFVERLGDPQLEVRVAALELLTALLAHPLLFDPNAPREDRKMMVHAVRVFYEANRTRLAWDPTRSMFVRR